MTSSSSESPLPDRALRLSCRRPAPGDTDELHRLFSVTIRHTFKAEGIDLSLADMIDREIANQMEVLRHDFDSGGSEEHFLLALYGERVVGTIASGRAGKIVRDNLELDDWRIPEVKSVYVLPEYHGQGIGSFLLRRMVEHLRGEGVAEFCLDSGYFNAQRFWTRRLGEPALVLQDYWGKGAHHMIWRCGANDVPKPGRSEDQ